MTLLKILLITLIKKTSSDLSSVFNPILTFLKRIKLKLICLLLCLFPLYHFLLPRYRAKLLVENCFKTFQIKSAYNSNEQIETIRSDVRILLIKLYKQEFSVNFLDLFNQNYNHFPSVYVEMHRELKRHAQLTLAYSSSIANLEKDIQSIEGIIKWYDASKSSFLSDLSSYFCEHFEKQLKLLDSLQSIVQFSRFSLQPQIRSIEQIKKWPNKVHLDGDIISSLSKVRFQIIEILNNFELEITALLQRMKNQFNKKVAELKIAFPHIESYPNYAQLYLKFALSLYELLHKLASDKLKESI